MVSGVYVYNVTLKPTVGPFPVYHMYAMELNFTGCDLNVNWLLDDGSTRSLCTAACPREGFLPDVVTKQCNGTGCCSHKFSPHVTITSLKLQLVRQHGRHGRHGRRAKAENQPNGSSPLDTIKVESSAFYLDWFVADGNGCAAASANKTTYACAGEHSDCIDAGDSYSCLCQSGYSGNPYLADGCSRDQGNIQITASL